MTLLATLKERGLLEELDVALAEALARRAGKAEPEVMLAAALASCAVHQGHVCFDLQCAPWLEESAGEVRAIFEGREPILRTLQSSCLVGSHRDEVLTRPLVLDEKGRIYLARYFDHERSVAHKLRALAGEGREHHPNTALIDALFPPTGKPGGDGQRDAAVRAFSKRLSVIVGGPGTGKTSTVVKLLALFIDEAARKGQRPPRILLTAPTGKAAQRLSESIETARERLAIDPSIKAAISSAAMTVHRALSPVSGSLTRFRHGLDHPLPCDILLVDEASMVDLALMRRLLDATPAHARVILLGDPDQLASVEAGGVLLDIVRAQEAGGPFAHVVSRLWQSHRYPEGSGIAQLARAVNEGDGGAALKALRGGFDDLALEAPVTRDAGAKALIKLSKQSYAGLTKNAVDERLDTLTRFRVLCAHQRGPDGALAINEQLARAIHGRGARAGEAYTGRPIIITQNDYSTNLFNGDVGVLATEPRRRELKAFFATGDHVRAVALGRLPSHASVYAMTVHKSQGSEHDHVAIVLPEMISPVVTRELLYTAITRAKKRVTIFASEGVLREAIKRRTERASGLRDALV